MLINLGSGAFVRADEIVAIDDHDDLGIKCEFVYNGDAGEIKSAVLLRNGKVVPSWIATRTLRQNWENALMLPFGGVDR